MGEARSTIILKLQADNKQTATKRKSQAVLYNAKCCNTLGPGSFLHFSEVRTPWAPRERAALWELGSSSSWWTHCHWGWGWSEWCPWHWASTNKSQSKRKECGRHQMLSTWDAHAVGLTFEVSKKYLLGKVFSGQETAVQVKLRTGNLHRCCCDFIYICTVMCLLILE